MKMKKVIINGIKYIGVLDDVDGKSVLSKAMEYRGSLDLIVLVEYMKAENAGDLQEITFGGTGISFSISELTPLQKLEFKECKMKMAYAKANAMAGVENIEFQKLMGK